MQERECEQTLMRVTATLYQGHGGSAQGSQQGSGIKEMKPLDMPPTADRESQPVDVQAPSTSLKIDNLNTSQERQNNEPIIIDGNLVEDVTPSNSKKTQNTRAPDS